MLRLRARSASYEDAGRSRIVRGARRVSGGGATAAAAPPQPMSFFVTSVGLGNGANLGGLAGADRTARRSRPPRALAAKTWHAYLSASGGGRAARRQRARPDRRRPLVQRQGRPHRAERRPICTATRSSRRGWATTSTKTTALNEKGEPINGVGDTPNQHDMLTGSQTDGRAYHRRRGSHLRQLDERRGGDGAARAPRPHRRRQHVVELDAPEPRLQPGEPGGHRRRGPVLLLRDQLKRARQHVHS